ncbi:MAG TPA: ubiquitin-activating E1 FCCH domain-containing protein, partial [Planctomycetota bacterium]|nr:ubiquitin-activating E1 FCCH domain-containing protein [Planctomycetota bacterium]
MAEWAQRSFSAGELAPALHGRADLARRGIGVKRLRNYRGLREGGAETRPGTQYIDETRFPAKKSVVRPFVKNASIGDSYAMEFGDLYLEFIRAGARVTETAKNITGITQANPAVVTSNAHGFSNGDDVIIASVGGMTQVNGRRFRVAGVTANTFQLQ